MKVIESEEFVEKLAKLIDSALKKVDEGTVSAIKQLKACEDTPQAAWALDQIIENAEIAKKTDSYPCQDTGLAVFFVEYGSSACFKGDLSFCINQAVRLGYKQARKSVADPITRLNTGDNTPAIIHTEIVNGDNIKITFLAKGAGSENMSKIYMLTPSKGREGIVNSVVDCVRQAGGNPCPPIVIGVGIGGDLEKCAILAKKALIRPVGKLSDRDDVKSLEQDIFKRVNALSIGAAGLGGNATAISVAAEVYPTHIGMLPVAVNIQCHSVRHGEIIF